MPVTERSIHLGLLAGAIAACALVFLPGGASTARQHRTVAEGSAAARGLLPLPPGPALELRVDLTVIRQAPLGAFFLRRLTAAPAAARLSSSCGFDAATRIDQLAFAIPSAGSIVGDRLEEFGIVASGRFSSAEIVDCATSTIRKRGGEPRRSRFGRFETVREGNAGRGEVAAQDGVLIVSGGAYFRDLLDSAQGTRPAHREEQAREVRHERLRHELGNDAAAARLTWLLEDGWFERVSGGERAARLSPLRALQAVAARLDLDRTARLSLVLDCADEESAEQIASTARDLSGSLAALPLDAVLLAAAARIRITRSGARLRFDLELDEAELEPVLDLVLAP